MREGRHHQAGPLMNCPSPRPTGVGHVPFQVLERGSYGRAVGLLDPLPILA